MPALTRRQLLIAASGLAVAGGGTVWLKSRREARSMEILLGLAQRTGLAAVAPRLGGEYLAAHPEEASTRELVRAIFPWWGPDEEGAARAALAQRIDRELAAGDVVLLDGWVVARTEGRFLALVTLLTTGSPVP